MGVSSKLRKFVKAVEGTTPPDDKAILSITAEDARAILSMWEALVSSRLAIYAETKHVQNHDDALHVCDELLAAYQEIERALSKAEGEK